MRIYRCSINCIHLNDIGGGLSRRCLRSLMYMANKQAAGMAGRSRKQSERLEQARLHGTNAPHSLPAVARQLEDRVKGCMNPSWPAPHRTQHTAALHCDLLYCSRSWRATKRVRRPNKCSRYLGPVETRHRPTRTPPWYSSKVSSPRCEVR